MEINLCYPPSVAFSFYMFSGSGVKIETYRTCRLLVGLNVAGSK
jgi:hypothetical protein